jgi:hypothetical protein
MRAAHYLYARFRSEANFFPKRRIVRNSTIRAGLVVTSLERRKSAKAYPNEVRVPAQSSLWLDE